MKQKILALGLLSLCCVAWFASDGNAWCRHHRCVTHITCRPYNAFTPICWGNLVCDGCCPSPCGVAGGYMPMAMGTPPWASSGMSCMGPAYGQAPMMGYAASPPMMNGPSMPMPDIRSAPFTPPTPMPVAPGGANISMNPYQGVSQANYYYPTYVPQYYMPNYYNPYQQMPYYWYGAR